jgi:hypothetical protein
MQPSKPPNASPPYTPLLETAYGALRAQILCVAAELGLAECLAQNGPLTASALAPKLGIDAAVLERVLRGLVSMSVCDEIEGSRFRLTAFGVSTLAGSAIVAVSSRAMLSRPYPAAAMHMSSPISSSVGLMIKPSSYCETAGRRLPKTAKFCSSNGSCLPAMSRGSASDSSIRSPET